MHMAFQFISMFFFLLLISLLASFVENTETIRPSPSRAEPSTSQSKGAHSLFLHSETSRRTAYPLHESNPL